METALKNAKTDRLILCLRDPRDCIASQIKYFYMPKDKIPWKNGLPVWVQPTVESAILDNRWMSKMIKLDAFLSKSNITPCFINFSELCLTPDKVKQKLNDYLKMDFSKGFDKVNVQTHGLEQWKTICPSIQLPKDWYDMAKKYNLV